MSENVSNSVRRTVMYSGMVQGVGFRYTTRAVASRFDVTGTVRNVPDGRVELVAEGAREELNRFQHAVTDALGRYIKDAAVEDVPGTDEFTSFTIIM